MSLLLAWGKRATVCGLAAAIVAGRDAGGYCAVSGRIFRGYEVLLMGEGSVGGAGRAVSAELLGAVSLWFCGVDVSARCRCGRRISTV